MEYSPMLQTLIPGAVASGIDVSVKRRGWVHVCTFRALDEFPTVNGTGVSAGRCRT